jgi:hypothetical protein
MYISMTTGQQEQAKLVAFLDKNNDVFTLSTSDLVGVSRDIIEHRLHMNPSAKPKRQKLHKMSEQKIKATKAKVQRLLGTGFIREVAYPKWLANIVMARKRKGKWRMCIDFTGLNKCCPKGDFPVARIDKIVDSAIGGVMMALLDCFLGYHQIRLHK